jgi:hypothetical protein
LEEATRRFNERDKEIPSSSVESGIRLLARNNFDAEALRRDIKSVQFMVRYLFDEHKDGNIDQ